MTRRALLYRLAISCFFSLLLVSMAEASVLADIFEGVTKGIIGAVTDDQAEQSKQEQSIIHDATPYTGDSKQRVNELIEILAGNVNAIFDGCYATFHIDEARTFLTESCDNVTDIQADEYSVHLGSLSPSITEFKPDFRIEVRPEQRTVASHSIIMRSTNGIRNISATYKHKYSIVRPKSVRYNGNPLPKNWYLVASDGDVTIYDSTWEIVSFDANKLSGDRCPTTSKFVASFNFRISEIRYASVLSALIAACGGKIGEFDS